MAIPLIMGQTNTDFLKRIFLYFLTLSRGRRGAFRSLCAGSHISWLVYYFAVPAAPGGQIQLGFDENSIVLSGWCCMAHTIIFTGTGPYSVMQFGVSPGSPVGNTND